MSSLRSRDRKPLSLKALGAPAQGKQRPTMAASSNNNTSTSVCQSCCSPARVRELRPASRTGVRSSPRLLLEEQKGEREEEFRASSAMLVAEGRTTELPGEQEEDRRASQMIVSGGAPAAVVRSSTSRVPLPLDVVKTHARSLANAEFQRETGGTSVANAQSPPLMIESGNSEDVTAVAQPMRGRMRALPPQHRHLESFDALCVRIRHDLIESVRENRLILAHHDYEDSRDELLSLEIQEYMIENGLPALETALHGCRELDAGMISYVKDAVERERQPIRDALQKSSQYAHLGFFYLENQMSNASMVLEKIQEERGVARLAESYLYPNMKSDDRGRAVNRKMRAACVQVQRDLQHLCLARGLSLEDQRIVAPVPAIWGSTTVELRRALELVDRFAERRAESGIEAWEECMSFRTSFRLFEDGFVSHDAPGNVPEYDYGEDEEGPTLEQASNSNQELGTSPQSAEKIRAGSAESNSGHLDSESIALALTVNETPEVTSIEQRPRSAIHSRATSARGQKHPTLSLPEGITPLPSAGPGSRLPTQRTGRPHSRPQSSSRRRLSSRRNSSRRGSAATSVMTAGELDVLRAEVEEVIGGPSFRRQRLVREQLHAALEEEDREAEQKQQDEEQHESPIVPNEMPPAVEEEQFNYDGTHRRSTALIPITNNVPPSSTASVDVDGSAGHSTSDDGYDWSDTDAAPLDQGPLVEPPAEPAAVVPAATPTGPPPTTLRAITDSVNDLRNSSGVSWCLIPESMYSVGPPAAQRRDPQIPPKPESLLRIMELERKRSQGYRNPEGKLSSLQLLADVMKRDLDFGRSVRGDRDFTKAEQGFVDAQDWWRWYGESRGVCHRPSGEVVKIGVSSFYLTESPVTRGQFKKMVAHVRRETGAAINQDLFPHHQYLVHELGLLPPDDPIDHREWEVRATRNEKCRRAGVPPVLPASESTVGVFTNECVEGDPLGLPAVTIARCHGEEPTASGPSSTVTFQRRHSATVSPPTWEAASALSPSDDLPLQLPLWAAREVAALVGASLPTMSQYEAALGGEEGLLFPWGNVMDPNLLFMTSQRSRVTSSGHNGRHASPLASCPSPFGVRGVLPPPVSFGQYSQHLHEGLGLLTAGEWNLTDRAYVSDARPAAFPTRSKHLAMSVPQYPKTGCIRSTALVLPQRQAVVPTKEVDEGESFPDHSGCEFLPLPRCTFSWPYDTLQKRNEAARRAELQSVDESKFPTGEGPTVRNVAGPFQGFRLVVEADKFCLPPKPKDFRPTLPWLPFNAFMPASLRMVLDRDPDSLPAAYDAGLEEDPGEIGPPSLFSFVESAVTKDLFWILPPPKQSVLQTNNDIEGSVSASFAMKSTSSMASLGTAGLHRSIVLDPEAALSAATPDEMGLTPNYDAEAAALDVILGAPGLPPILEMPLVAQLFGNGEERFEVPFADVPAEAIAALRRVGSDQLWEETGEPTISFHCCDIVFPYGCKIRHLRHIGILSVSFSTIYDEPSIAFPPLPSDTVDELLCIARALGYSPKENDKTGHLLPVSTAREELQAAIARCTEKFGERTVNNNLFENLSLAMKFCSVDVEEVTDRFGERRVSKVTFTRRLEPLLLSHRQPPKKRDRLAHFD